MTWSEIQKYKQLFLKSLDNHFLPWQDWFRGILVGFNIGDNNYRLNVYVVKECHISLAAYVFDSIGYKGPYQIGTTDVTAAT